MVTPHFTVPLSEAGSFRLYAGWYDPDAKDAYVPRWLSSGVEAMMEICKPSYVIDPISGLALGRTIETVAKMEKDPVLRENNIAT